MARKPFRYLSHTADVEFVAYGKNLKEAVENAALALLNVALDIKKITDSRAPRRSITISEKADSIENLVWFVLQDINSKRASGYLNAYGFKVDKISRTKNGLGLKGRLLHKKISGDHTVLDVKAVTPHDLMVTTGKGRCSIRVTLDV